jgi:hypothetical protein
MSDTHWQERMGPSIRTLQIFVAGLVFGLVVFSAISVVISPIAGEQDDEDVVVRKALTYTGIAWTAAGLLAFAIVPGLVLSKARRRIVAGTWQPPQQRRDLPVNAQLAQFLEETGDAGKLMTVLHTRTIIAAALLEGLGFFWLIVHMVTNTPLSLIAAIAFIIGVACHFPTRSRVLHWIEDQLRLVDQQRQFGQ